MIILLMNGVRRIQNLQLIVLDALNPSFNADKPHRVWCVNDGCAAGFLHLILFSTEFEENKVDSASNL